MEKTAAPNPLKQYFRQFKIYIRLPSGTDYYPSGTIDFTDSGEVGIMPMTGRDEIILKNPDALLNGEAMVQVITSCVPAVKDAKKLLTNDIDALITGIRYATYNDGLETDLNCPSCGHEGHFKLDLAYALENMTYLEGEYAVHLDSGLSVIVRPYIYPEVIAGLHSEFERSKLIRSVESENISDERRIKVFSEALRAMTETSFRLVAESIIKIVDERAGIDVSSKEHIREFLQNIDKKSINKITDLINEINQIGIQRNFTANCEKCQHQWQAPMDFNPVNFS